MSAHACVTPTGNLPQASVCRASSTMSKKRYQELSARLECELGDQMSAIALRLVCEVLRFDPLLPQYTPELGRRHGELRAARARELGVSVSQLAKKGVARILESRNDTATPA